MKYRPKSDETISIGLRGSFPGKRHPNEVGEPQLSASFITARGDKKDRGIHARVTGPRLYSCLWL